MEQIARIFKAIESDDIDYIRRRVEMFGEQPNEIYLKNQFNIKNNKGDTPLHRAIIHRNIEMCELLIEGGVNVNIKDGHGNTPLHYATYKGYTEIVQLLINSNADMNIKHAATGRTALHLAINRGHTEVVQLLIKGGADMNIKTDIGTTVLNYAAERGHPEIVHLLIEAGADPYIPDQDGKKPIDNPMIREIYKDYEILKSHQRLSLAKTLTIDPEDSRYILPPEILEQIATAKRPGPSSEVRDRYKAEAALSEVPAASEDEVKPTCTHNCAIQGSGRVGGSKRRTKKIRKSKRKKRSKKKRSKKR